MLPKQNRLLKNSDFARVIRQGRAAAGGNFLLKYAKTDNHRPRFGFVISTKVSKKAVERNLLKRRMREIVKSRVATGGDGRDFVFIARKSALSLTFPELKSEVMNLLSRTR